MSELSQAEQYLLDQIRKGQSDAWSQLVERYQGRLLAFTQMKIRQREEAEDIVQETFVGFLKAFQNFRGDASLETFLFTILRRKIADSFRGKQSRRICLLQDVYHVDRQSDAESDAFGHFASAEPTASWYARRSEQHSIQKEVLAQALQALVAGLKESLDFRDLKIIEMLLYCKLPNKDVAKVLEMSEKNIAVIKHRCLKQIREKVEFRVATGEVQDADFENMLTEVWESLRLSCPKRSTIGAFLLGTLEEQWGDYVDFHVNRLGCHFCQANLEDLKRQTADSGNPGFRARIMESTVGFLSKS